MFFSSWYALLRIVVIAACGYVILIALLRMSGKRTLSKLNAFDLVITVAIGSTFSNLVVSKDTALADGAIALATLIGLQFLVTWSSVRTQVVDRLAKAEPTLLFYGGEFRENTMKRERVTKGEVLGAVRRQGIESLEQAAAVVLETGGELTVIRRSGRPPTSLADVPACESSA